MVLGDVGHGDMETQKLTKETIVTKTILPQYRLRMRKTGITFPVVGPI